MTVSISRRSFVASSAGAAAVLVGMGFTGKIAGDGELLRPPGGQDELRFIARCNRCGRCVSVCHAQAVGVAHFDDGLVNARTPVMRFSLGACDFCADCAKACPTGALAPLEAETACIGIARLDTSVCLSYTSSSCNLCYAECPYEAIELSEAGNPVVVEDTCNGCGVCENVCPVLSLRSYIGGDSRAIAVVSAKSYTKGGE